MIVRSDFMAHLTQWMSMALVAALITGCATERGVLNFGITASSPEVKRMTWPPMRDAEVPRYVFAGELTGEENFRAPREKKSGTSAFLYWLAGLLSIEEKPVILQRPQSGVVDKDGRIFVTDTSRQAVFVFDPQEGRLIVWEGIATTRFDAPTGIALGTAGEIYVADSNLGFVARLNSKGEGIGVIGLGELHRPVGVAFDAATQRLYVADTQDHDIKVFDEEGRLLHTLGRRGEKPGEFNFPTYIALAKGELYVADTMNARVQVLDAETGDPRRVIGERGINVGNLARPKGVSVDSEGNVYIVESYYDYLLVFNNKGEFLMPIGGTGQEVGNFYLPSGVWIDESNRIFVADVFNGRVSLFQFLGGERNE